MYDIDVYFDLSLTPEEFYKDLCDLHEEIHITDITPLLRELENDEQYELCIVVQDFAKDKGIPL